MKNKTLLLKIALAVPMLLCVLWLTSCSEGLETNLHEITENFTDITVNANTANVTVAPTDGDCLVKCIEKENVRHEVSVIDGELKIEFVDNRKFYEKIFGSWKTDITLYLPKADYNSIALFTDTGHIKLSDNSFNSVAINTSTGEIDLEGVKAKDGFIVTVDTGDVELKKCEAASISVETDTGDINFEEISCNSLNAESNTGEMEIEQATVTGKLNAINDTGHVYLDNCEANELAVSTDTGRVNIDSISCTFLGVKVSTANVLLENVIAEGKFDITSSTGDITFDRCDAASVFVTTSTGDVEGNFLTDKIIFADTSTGKVDIPKLTSGGKCEITTSTGDIKISIEK